MSLFTLLRQIALLSLLTCTVMLSGCYLSPPDSAEPHDPLQHLNRDTNRMNSKLDSLFVKPIATKYQHFTPYFLRAGVSHLFNNLDEPENVVNDLLQGHMRWALNDTWSFVINSTVGIAGLWDPAKHIGLQAHSNDFALTLNQWGLYTAYFVLPLAGPRTIGSSVAIPIDYSMGVTQFFIPLRYSVVLTIVDNINARAGLLNAEQTANGLIFDKYIFYRSAYLQHRAYLYKLNQQGPEYRMEQPEQQAISNDNALLPEQPLEN